MQKDFRRWHVLKEVIHNEGQRAFFHEREIWWCSLGASVGSEEDGKNDGFERPVLIFKKFNNEVFWAVPITSRPKAGPFYYIYEHDGRSFAVILSQIRLLDAKRLRRKVHILPRPAYRFLEDQFRKLL